MIVMNYIEFPNLGIKFNIDPVAFKIGSFEIYWYAIIIAFGIVAGFLYALHFCKKNGDDTDLLYDVLLFGLPSAIICARIYYVGFNFNAYRDNLWDIFNIHGGGLAIYGGVIGAVMSTYIYARIKKVNPFWLFDYGAAGLFVGQTIGRWGNFVNQEAFGGNYDGLFSMKGNIISETLSSLKAGGLSVDPDIGVHPTFLYESLWNFMGIILIAFIFKNKKRDGQPFAFYIGWYGLGRFFIEGMRTDSLMLTESIRISQVVALLSVAVSIIIFFKTGRKETEGGDGRT